jgi:hypothetical protein
MSIDSLDQVQAGDIMIADQSEAPAKIVVYGGQLLIGEQFRIGKFAAGHAAIVVPGGKLVEAMPHGARIRDLTSADWSPNNVFFRLSEDYPGQALDAAAVAMAMIDTPYSILSYLYLGAYRFGFKSQWLKSRINRRRPLTTFILPSGRTTKDNLPLEEICSVLAEQSWTLTGKTVIRGTAPQVVTPGKLTEELWIRSGIDRGGAGLL